MALAKGDGMPVLLVVAVLSVFPPKVVNLTDGEAAAAVEVFTSALQQEGVDGPVEWSLVRLANHIVLEARVGERHVEMTATSLDDLPGVARRVARSLATGQPVEDTRTPQLVTGVEARSPNRSATKQAGGFFLMPVKPLSGGTAMEPAIAFGVDVRLEKETYFYQVALGFLVPTGATNLPGEGGMFGDLGAARELSAGNTAPYVGGGISGRIIGGFGTVIAGLAPFANLGVTFDRSSSSHFYVELRLAQNLIPLNEHGDSGVTTSHYVTEAGARVGLVF